MDENEKLAREIIKYAGSSFAYLCIAEISRTKLREEWHNEMLALSLKDDLWAKEYFKMLKSEDNKK